MQVESDKALAAKQSDFRRLMYYFAVVYIAEGLAQVNNGVISLPLTYFLEDLGWNSASISSYLSVLGLPWVVKPLYGLLSDCVPLFGYRRKSYLLLVNFLAVVAYAWLALTAAPGLMLPAMLIITIAMAASSTLCGALVVEHGRDSGNASRLCGQQALWASLARISAGFLGGLVCYLFVSPAAALHVAALISLTAPLFVVLTTGRLVSEEKTAANLQQLKRGLHGIWLAVSDRSLWGVALFLALWAFNPGFGAPLNLHMKNDLHFSKAFAGVLAGVFAGGSALGAFVYMRFLASRFTVKQLAAALIVLGAASQASFIFMQTEPVALGLQFLFGATTAMAMLNAHVIAASRCPANAEGFMYAMLISASNMSFFASQAVGGYLYEYVFQKKIDGLLLISAAITLCCLVILPFFKFESRGTTR
ncbi:MAG: MFS transporter [Candidatus Obscuribacterales bacterium]|nr:MFS transporter [Candidatus Obscuribacterales bacterium]